MASPTSIYLSGLYPIRLSRLDIRHHLFRHDPQALSDRIRKAIQEHPSLRLKAVHPRFTDGGAIAEFELGDRKLRDRLIELVQSSGALSKPWWMGGVRSGAYPVKGTPWLEDLDHFPNRTIHIEFDGPELSQESLWHLIRPFGRIKSIDLPNPKDPVRIARITLESVRAATVARNCLHGYQSHETRLRILYAPNIKAHAFRAWIMSHPRIVLPTLVILLGSISYALFDPIRTFFIRSQIYGAFDLHQYQLVNWLEKETGTRFASNTPDADRSGEQPGPSMVEEERMHALEQLRGWILGLPESFVVVSGPKGSGKSALVDEVIRPRKNVVKIDCERICKDGANERKRVKVLANEVGYFPYFSFLVTFNHLIDIVSVGLIGQKAGFEKSTQSEIRQILERVEVALANISEGVSKKRINGGRPLPSDSAMGEPLFENEKNSSKVGMYGGYDDVPVVVLKGFYSKQASKDDYLWDEFSDWASRLIEKKIAHVIFTCEPVGNKKSLSKALPSRAMNFINLKDATPESALQYIAQQMPSPQDRMKILNPSNASLIEKLGGRLTELDLLAEKIRTGISLEAAVEEIVMRSVMEIKKMCVRDGESDGAGEGGKWTREQVWELVRALDGQDKLKWHATVVDVFNGDEEGVYALQDTDLITIVHRETGAPEIRLGKPCYRSAIRKLLTEDVTFTAYQDRMVLVKKLKRVEEEMSGKIKELIELGKLFPVIGSIGTNSNWSLGSMNGKLPNEIKWKVDKVLKKLKVLEEEVDRLEELIQEAKRNILCG